MSVRARECYEVDLLLRVLAPLGAQAKLQFRALAWYFTEGILKRSDLVWAAPK
jgi:hypothetical protein